MANKIEVTTGGGWVAFALLVIYFYGDPDLHDLVISLIKNHATP